MWDFSQFLGGNQTHFCFKMLLNVSDLVSGAHLLPPKSFLIKDRDALVLWSHFLWHFSLSSFPTHHSIIKSFYLCIHHFLVMASQFQTLQSSKIAVPLPQTSILHQGPSYLYFRYQVWNDEVGRTEIRCCIHMILKHHTRRWKDMGFSVVSLSSLQLSCSPAFISYDIIGNRIPQMRVWKSQKGRGCPGE